MQTHLPPELIATDTGKRADAVLRSCVHCGFCTATCPTYLLTGDERDGPRGRIYLIKSMLEGNPVSERTRLHLDRCLTCRACETACPSGVQYHQLLDIGRAELDQRHPRPVGQRWQRRWLAFWLSDPVRVRRLLYCGRLLSRLLPKRLRQKLPPPQQPPPPPAPHPQQGSVVLLEGCVQSAATPNTNRALVRILARQGITARTPSGAGCCGALHYHLDQVSTATQKMRQNIDSWWATMDEGTQAIIAAASGCGAHLKAYGELLTQDPAYAAKAERVAALVKDPCELIQPDWLVDYHPPTRGPRRIAYHPPCTLQHGQRLTGRVETLLRATGYELLPVADSHLCCGSAGTYSLLQPGFSSQLLENKITALEAPSPDAIVTANVGCQLHLASATRRPVYHWLELIDAAAPPEEQLTSANQAATVAPVPHHPQSP